MSAVSLQDHWDAFWLSAENGALALQRCDVCSQMRFPPAAQCTNCLSPQATLTSLSGTGRIWSFCVYHHAYRGDLRDQLPYAIALVDLNEGPRIIARLTGRDPDDWSIGERVVFAPSGVDESKRIEFMPMETGA